MKLEPLPPKENAILLHWLRNDDKKGYVFLVQKFRYSIIMHVIDNSGTQKQGELIFDVAVDKLITTIHKHYTQVNIEVQAYFIKISTNLWMREAKRVKNYDSIGDDENIGKISSVEEEYIKSEQADLKSQILQKQLKKIQSNCRKILTEFYLNRKSLAQIAKKLKAKSVESIKTQRNTCLNYLKKLVTTEYDNYNKIAYD